MMWQDPTGRLRNLDRTKVQVFNSKRSCRGQIKMPNRSASKLLLFHTEWRGIIRCNTAPVNSRCGFCKRSCILVKLQTRHINRIENFHSELTVPWGNVVISIKSWSWFHMTVWLLINDTCTRSFFGIHQNELAPRGICSIFVESSFWQSVLIYIFFQLWLKCRASQQDIVQCVPFKNASCLCETCCSCPRWEEVPQQTAQMETGVMTLFTWTTRQNYMNFSWVIYSLPAKSSMPPP